MPSAQSVRENKCLRCFGKLLHEPALWHLSRHSLAKAFFVGLFCAMMPVPFQMVIAAAGAIWLHSNLPIAVALVWLTNPLTMPPVFYLAYLLGDWVLQMPEREFHFEASLSWAMHEMTVIWQPFLLGCVLLGLISGVLGYVFVQCVWRAMIVRRWNARHHREAHTH
jgi:uncharacterized protein (DUF2062 family)